MALIKCKGCGQMVSDRAEKCPKCGYPIRLSMEQQQKESEQSVKTHFTTETEKKETINNNLQPRQKSSKKGFLIAAVVAVIIGCGVLFAIFSSDSNPIIQQTRDIPSVETELQNVQTVQEAKQLIEGTVWEHTVNTDESELGYWVKVEFANGRYKTFYMNPSDDDWSNGGEGTYEIKEGKFANTGEKYIAVYWEGGGYLGWPTKYALVLNNFQITVQSALPDPDALFSYEPQPTSNGFMKLVEVFEVENKLEDPQLPSDTLAVATRTNRQDIFSPDTLAVAKENDDVIVSDSCITEAWEYITLYGTMTDINGTYPIELSFEKDGNKLMNCIYTNVDLGGKIKMGGEIIGSELVFTGKDGMYKFQIRIDRDTFDGIATDGPKELSVSLNKKY